MCVLNAVMQDLLTKPQSNIIALLPITPKTQVVAETMATLERLHRPQSLSARRLLNQNMSYVVAAPMLMRLIRAQLYHFFSYMKQCCTSLITG